VRLGVVLARVTEAPLIVASVQAPAGPRPMMLLDSMNMPAVSAPELSPDGRQVLYQLSKADW